jgi:tRNA 2-thiocytidine biosynthesis protein TtcA
MLRVGDRLLRRSVGKAIHQYQMIENGDRIAVGVSGGKDSLSLLNLLSERRRRVPIQYDLVAIHIDLGFDGTGKEIEPYFRQEEIPYRIEETRIGPIAHSEINRENPCFLCARLRRKRLFELADGMGCRKVALAHHRDDIIETLLLNMFYGGEIGTMIPHQRLFKGKLSIIRPLALTDEDAIWRYAKAQAFPIIESGCPTTEDSERNRIKAILAELTRNNKKIKGNIFRSMQNIRRDYLP